MPEIYSEEDIKQDVENRSLIQHEDPRGEFPSAEYFNSSSVNYAATGSKKNELYFKGKAAAAILEEESEDIIASEYPLCQIQQTISGHIIETDDTIGAERILIRHNSGAGVELTKDGGIKISSLDNQINVTGGDQTIIVEGEGQLIYKGNLNLKVTGNFNVDCLNYNVTVRGNKVEKILGNIKQSIAGNIEKLVGGSYVKAVTQAVTNTFLAGKKQNIKGEYINRVEGSARYSTSDNTKITAEDKLTVSSNNMNQFANSMAVTAKSGTIGNPNMVFSGKGAVFEAGVTAPTFHGDLDGTATTATVAQSQNYADPSTGGGVGSAGTITNTATPAITKPTNSIIDDYLTKSAGGINRVKIDVGDFIKNYLDRSIDTGGISNSDIDASKARSRLRDISNRNNSAFISHLLSEGVISREWNSPIPKGTGRIISSDATPVSSSSDMDRIGSQTENRLSAFIPKRANPHILPEEVYNPYKQKEITATTKLAEGITLSKFLGSDDPTNIDFIRDQSVRVELAKYLYIHARIIKLIQDNKTEFKDVNLEVAESIYRPGPSETITPGSLNDLKLKGRTVVYNVVDNSGRSNPSRAFEVAVFLKDNSVYDEFILSYDTLDLDLDTGKELLSCRIIITLPEIDKNWVGIFNRKVKTEFNYNDLTSGDMVEVLPESRFESEFDGVLSLGENYGINLSSANNPYITRQGDKTHPSIASGAVDNMNSLLANQYTLMQQYYGGKLIINDALPKANTSRKVARVDNGYNQHWFGKALDISVAGMSNAQKDKLVAAATKAGFKGFGFGNTILHIDIGVRRVWSYDNTHFAGREVGSIRQQDGYWFRYVRANAAH
tara:strand:+ start:4364 stop:6874 length:2511 start_codon:yes stop_codon:yes gene_type:complete